MVFEFLELLGYGVMDWFRVGGTYKANGQTHDAADEEAATARLLSGSKLLGWWTYVGKEAIRRDRSCGAVRPFLWNELTSKFVFQHSIFQVSHYAESGEMFDESTDVFHFKSPTISTFKIGGGPPWLVGVILVGVQ